VPPHVAAAVARALEKLPADRFTTAHDFAQALADPAHAETMAARGATGRPARRATPERAAMLAVTALLLVAAAWGWLRPRPDPTFHTSIPAPAGTAFLPIPRWPALSPDGKTVVFAAAKDGETQLYRRPVDGFRAEPIEGSDGATYPFMAPDGRWVGYYTSSRQLRKVPLAGGQSVHITDIPFWYSFAVWRRNGTIVVAGDGGSLYVVPDHGGNLALLTPADSAADTLRLTFPQELPDGRLVANRTSRATFGRELGGQLMMLDDGVGIWHDLPGDVGGIVVPQGFLLTQPGSEFQATRYDVAAGTTRGKPLPVLEGANYPVVDPRGDVAYFALPAAVSRYLAVVDRTGSARHIPVPAQNFRHPRLSPDGKRLAVTLDGDIWVLDLGTNAWTRLTTSADVTEPQWSPDGRQLAHTVYDTASGFNPPAIRSANGLGGVRILPTDIGDAWTSDWSRDGRHLAVYGGKVGLNVFVVDLDSAATVHAVTNTRAVARNPRFSPDGRFLAYQSNETGGMQVYVVSWPDLATKRPISTEGGTEPAWRPQGGELYYRSGPRMMVVPIRTAPELEVGTPRELFRGVWLEDLYGDRSYDVTPDGSHFIMFEANPASAPELRVIRNWSAELQELTR